MVGTPEQASLSTGLLCNSNTDSDRGSGPTIRNNNNNNNNNNNMRGRSISWWMATAVVVIAMLGTTPPQKTAISSHRFGFGFPGVAEAFVITPRNGRRQQQQQQRTTQQRTTQQQQQRFRATDTAVAATASDTATGKEDPITAGLPGRDLNELCTEAFVETAKRNVFGGPPRMEHVDVDAGGVFRPPPGSLPRDRIVLITGATTGLGLESAKRLALAGATVILTGRTREKATRAVNDVRDYCRRGTSTSTTMVNPNPVVRGIQLDLEDLASVRSFPDRYRDCLLPLSKITDRDEDVEAMLEHAKTKTRSESQSQPTSQSATNSNSSNKHWAASTKTTKKIDVLLNNAGAAGYQSRETTVDGYERTFQSCHLGHFLLTARLFEEGLLNGNRNHSEGDNDDDDDDYTQGGGCTVINVSSVAHGGCRARHGSDDTEEDVVYGLDFDNLQSEIAYENDVYAQSKLANILFTRELQRRSSSACGLRLRSVSLHPGIVASDIWRSLPEWGYDPRTHAERFRRGEVSEQPPGGSWVDRFLLAPLYFRVMTQIEQGANCHVWTAYAALVGENNNNNDDKDKDKKTALIGGEHYGEFGTIEPVAEFASDEHAARRLWEVSEELVGARFDLCPTPPAVAAGSSSSNREEQDR